MTTSYRFLSSPFGKILVAWSERGLERVGIRGDSEKPEAGWRFEKDLECEATRQLEEYFAGERRTFELPMVLESSPFRVRVWRSLARIPFGETLSYGEVGDIVGSQNASRAVGLACGANPLPIVIPCHRVIGANGKLVGFGGGLDMKRSMLAFERSHAPKVGTTLSLGLDAVESR
jgi:methylated-DNA-[protein]-cysteine S-methyltransferase